MFVSTLGYNFIYLVFCTGKFYYDLLKHREENERNDVALVRIEQLFPLPISKMKEVMEKYKNAEDVVWAQEEPRNMGAYSHLLLHFEEARKFRVCSRKFYGSPAAGSSVRFKKRHERVINSVFDKNLNEEENNYLSILPHLPGCLFPCTYSSACSQILSTTLIVPTRFQQRCIFHLLGKQLR